MDSLRAVMTDCFGDPGLVVGSNCAAGPCFAVVRMDDFGVQDIIGCPYWTERFGDYNPPRMTFRVSCLNADIHGVLIGLPAGGEDAGAMAKAAQATYEDVVQNWACDTD